MLKFLKEVFCDHFYLKKIHVFHVPGATISGIDNPSSKTQSHNIFKSAIDKYKGKIRKCIVLLGEVDTGFVLWYKQEH